MSKKLKPGKKSLLCLPTGTGKTFTAASWIHAKKRKTLWLAHRNELISQAYGAFESLGSKVTIWNADEKDAGGDIIIASILSTSELHNELPEVDTIVCDEAHHFPMPSISGDDGIIQRIKWNRILGLTATPTRLDGKDLGFDSISYQRTFYDMVEKGWLAKPSYNIVRTGIKLDLKKVNGRFTRESLKQVNSEARNKAILQGMRDAEYLGKTLIFAVDNTHAKSLLEELEEFNPVMISQENTKKERREINEAFYKGKIQTLINCEIYTEGVDVPDIDTIVLGRPTASKVLYMQCIGRGARITETKKSFNIIDVVDSDKHYGVMSERWSMEELGHNIDVEVVRKSDERAHKFAEENDIDYKKLLSKFDISSTQVVGVIKFRSFEENYVMPLSQQKMEAILLWQDHIMSLSRKIKNGDVYLFYTVYGSPAGFSLSNWKKVSKSLNSTILGFDRQYPAEIIPFRELPPVRRNTESSSVILDEIKRINTIMSSNKKETINKIVYSVKNLVTPKVYHVIQSAEYKYSNGIIEVNLGLPFNRLKPFLPARLVLQQVANEILDTEIIDISYSAWKHS